MNNSEKIIFAKEITKDWSGITETTFNPFFVRGEDNDYEVVLDIGYAQENLAEETCKKLNEIIKDLANER